MADVPPLEVSRYKRIVVLTGAGISVASGLRTYRGPGGLWEEDEGAARMADADTLAEEPLAVWQFFGPLREMARKAAPNPAHAALASLEAVCRSDGSDSDRTCTVITQNVDGLHLRAGSKSLIEFHGSILRTRCSHAACDLPAFDDVELHAEALPVCERCGKFLRPDIVLFGEEIPPTAAWGAKKALRECDLFIAIGTSGAVYPAAGFARAARFGGARTVLVNLEALEPEDPSFQEEFLGKAEELLPILFRD